MVSEGYYYASASALLHLKKPDDYEIGGKSNDAPTSPERYV